MLSEVISRLIRSSCAVSSFPRQREAACRTVRFCDPRQATSSLPGIVELETFTALGIVRGRGFAAWVIPTPIPLIGYEFLQSMRFRVNTVTEELEEVPEEEIHPPYLLTALVCDPAGAGE